MAWVKAHWTVILAAVLLGARELTAQGINPVWHGVSLATLVLVGVALYSKIPGAKPPILPVLGLFFCLASSGCMAAVQQPGQTPAQVSACSTDATLHNVLLGAAGILTTGTATEASIAATQDANVSKTLAITGAATGGAAAALLGASVLVAQTYNNDRCAPALPGAP